MDRVILNQKVWYRGLKVVFILIFILGQGLGFFVTKEVVADAQALMVLCDNGSEFLSPYSYLYSDIDKLAVNIKCNPDGKSGEVVKILSEDKRRELDGLVLKMEAQKISQREIQLFVNDFKNKHGLVPIDFSKYGLVKPGYLVPSYTTYYTDKYSSAEKSIYYLLSFVIVSVIFWLISRTFFYIFAKEKFLKLPLE